MGSLATEDRRLMRIVLSELKKRGLIFIDSRTSLKSIAYELAQEMELISGYNQGFLDAVDDIDHIAERMEVLINMAREKGKIIVIAHPLKNTLEFLKSRMPDLRKKIDFVTIKDYFEL